MWYLDMVHTPRVPQYFAASSRRNWDVRRRPFRNCAHRATVRCGCRGKARVLVGTCHSGTGWVLGGAIEFDKIWTTVFDEAYASLRPRSRPSFRPKRSRRRWGQSQPGVFTSLRPAWQYGRRSTAKAIISPPSSPWHANCVTEPRRDMTLSALPDRMKRDRDREIAIPK